MLESTWASSVVGTWTTGMPRRKVAADEADHVADDAAADGDQEVAAIRPGLEQPVVEALDAGQRLLVLAAVDGAARGTSRPTPRKRRLDALAVALPDDCVGDDARPALQARPVDRLGDLVEASGPTMRLVWVAPALIADRARGEPYGVRSGPGRARR